MSRLRLIPLGMLFVALLGAGLLAGCQPEPVTASASISGGVFFDCNRDGDCNEADCGVRNADIRLYGGACGGELLQVVKTREDGSFAFPDLAAGEYCVFLDARLETCGFEGNFPTNAISRRATLAPGDRVVLNWFGLTRLGDGAAQPLDAGVGEGDH